MELFKGQTIEQLIRSRLVSDDLTGSRPIPLGMLLNILLQVVQCLEMLHEAGYVHRDIHQANVIIQPDEQIKIFDFGRSTKNGEPDDDLIARLPFF